jgi:Zn-dependent membrane protease YugP
LSNWWWIAILLYVPSVARSFAMIAYMRGAHRLDAAIPDDLPYTAGEWLAREIDRLGLSGRVRSIVSDGMRRNAFHPRSSVIQLHADTHFKRDAVQWATAAHELGHAQFWLRHPRLAAWLHRGEVACYVLAIAGAGIAIGNALFALPGATQLAHRVLAAAAILQLARLGTEAHASILGMRSLRASPLLGSHHLRSSRGAMLLAFGTYFAGAAARALLLTQWRLVERISTIPRVPPLESLTSIGFVVAAVLTLVLAAVVVVHVAALIMSRKTPLALELANLVGIIRAVAVAGFVYLAWNTRADASYAHLVMLAATQAIGVVIAVLGLPLVIVDTLVLAPIVKRAIATGGVHQTEELERDRRAGRKLVDEGNDAVKALHDGSFASRVWVLAQLAFVPLVIAFWASVV